MGFMSSYKRLDILCRDMNGIGISGYISDMEKDQNHGFVQGWEEDYKNLKHYRWVRNQIAHEADAEEENMCGPEDIEWIEDFYRRIMLQTDPLAAAYKGACSKKTVQHVPAPIVPPPAKPNPPHPVPPPAKQTPPAGCFTFVLAAAGLGLAALLLL